MLKRKQFALVVAALLVNSCNSNTEPVVDPALCPQTYEFGNYGCARIMVIVDAPSTPLPASHIWDLRVAPVDKSTGVGASYGDHPVAGEHLLQLTQFFLPRVQIDTMTIWATARVIDVTDSRLKPLPIFAGDSVMHIVRFAPVGTRPQVDTVRLILRP